MKKFEEAELKVILLENSVISTSTGCASTTEEYQKCHDPRVGGTYDQSRNDFHKGAD